MNSINGKVVVITGASRRIGSHLAKNLSQNGATIAIHYNKSKTEAENLLNNIKSSGGNAQIFQADFRDILKIEEFFESIVKQFGKVDILINNASVFNKTDMNSLKVDEVHDLFNINLHAPLFLSKCCFEYLKKENGLIINITDNSSYKPWKNFLVYGMTKAGLYYLTEGLSLEFAPFVRVNGISLGSYIFEEDYETKKPSFIDRIPLKKNVSLDDIAKSIIYLYENKTITGEIIRIDCGEFYIR